MRHSWISQLATLAKTVRQQTAFATPLLTHSHSTPAWDTSQRRQKASKQTSKQTRTICQRRYAEFFGLKRQRKMQRIAKPLKKTPPRACRAKRGEKKSRQQWPTLKTYCSQLDSRPQAAFAGRRNSKTSLLSCSGWFYLFIYFFTKPFLRQKRNLNI